MNARRKVEIFSAGCPLCAEVVDMVKDLSCPSCDVNVRDMNDPVVSARAKELGIRTLPAVAVDGKLAECCANRGVDRTALQDAGIGVPIS